MKLPMYWPRSLTKVFVRTEQHPAIRGAPNAMLKEYNLFLLWTVFKERTSRYSVYHQVITIFACNIMLLGGITMSLYQTDLRIMLNKKGFKVFQRSCCNISCKITKKKVIYAEETMSYAKTQLICIIKTKIII